MVDFSGMRAAVLSAFGESVTILVGGLIVHTVRAAFIEPNAPMEIGGVVVSRPEPQLVLETSAWEATAGTTGDVVTRQARPYTVVDVQGGDDGFTTLVLRA